MLRRAYRLTLSSLIPLLLLANIVSQANPHWFFNQSVTLGNIQLYANQRITGQQFAIDDAISLLAHSPLYNPAQRYHVVIANNALLYRWLTFDLFSHAFARTNLFNRVIIRHCEPATQRCHSPAAQYNRRSLAGLMAHEITHITLRDEFGYLRTNFMPAWKVEGYADYIADSSSFNDNNGLSLFIKGNGPDHPAFDYFQYRVLVTYLLENRRWSVDKLFNTKLSADDIRKKMLADNAGMRPISHIQSTRQRQFTLQPPV